MEIIETQPNTQDAIDLMVELSNISKKERIKNENNLQKC